MFTKRHASTTTVILALALASAVLANGFTISRSTVDGGGEMFSTGGDFELSGTIGQADAGVLTGGGFQLTGGFWFEQPPGDCNSTGNVNLFDHADFEACLSGPGGGVAEGCACFDLDGSGDVDLLDVAAFQESFTG